MCNTTAKACRQTAIVRLIAEFEASACFRGGVARATIRQTSRESMAPVERFPWESCFPSI